MTGKKRKDNNMPKNIKEELRDKTNDDKNQSVSEEFKMTLDNEDNEDDVKLLKQFKHLNVYRDEMKFKELVVKAHIQFGYEYALAYKADEEGNITEVCKYKR